MEQVKKKKVGVITLAVGLIIIGSLWTLQNIYPMPWIPRVVTLWPVLLILYGLELIITKLIYEGKEGISVTIDVGIIILLIFFVLVSGGISMMQNILPQLGINMGMYPNVEVSVKEEWEVEAEIEKIVINHDFGEVRIMSSEENKIILDAKVSLNTEDEDAFKEWAKEAFRMERRGNTLYIERNSYNGQLINQNVPSSNTRIYLPEQLFVQVENKFGAVYAEGLQKGALIKGNNGSINIDNIAGNIEIDNQFGDIHIENIQGEVKANNKNGKIEIKKITESIFARNQFGDIDIQEALKGIDVENNNGSIYLDIPEIQGDIVVDNEFGSIGLKSAKYEDVYIKASTKFGNINSDIGLESEIEDGQGAEKELTIGKGTFKILLENENGDISIQNR